MTAAFYKYAGLNRTRDCSPKIYPLDGTSRASAFAICTKPYGYCWPVEAFLEPA